MDKRNTILGGAARTYNILTAKLQHSFVPMSVNGFKDMPELRDAKPVQIRDCLRGLHKKGLIRRAVIYNPANRQERVGYEWARPAAGYKTSILPMPLTEPKGIQTKTTTQAIISDIPWAEIAACKPGDVAPLTAPTVQDLHLKVNDDGSVTIITSKIRITIEVPR